MNKDEYLKIEYILVDLVLGDGLAFRLVESENFKNFVHSLNSLFKIPCRKTISNKGVEE